MSHLTLARGEQSQTARIAASSPLNSHCPWSGKPVSQSATTLYRDHALAFCNPGCRDKFERATGAFDRAIDEYQKDHARPAGGLIAEPYFERYFTDLGVHKFGASTFKTYHIAIDALAEVELDPHSRAYLNAFVEANLNGEQIGFVMTHAGEEADWLLLYWWSIGGILHRHIVSRRADQDGFDLADPSIVACVWEQIVIEYERKAWVRHVLTASPSRSAYLQDVLPNGRY